MRLVQQDIFSKLIDECFGVQLLYTAHVGDSRGVLVRDGEAARLTEDHKPLNPQERQRIIECGGKVNPARNRVMGRSASDRMHMLAMSR